MSRSHDDEIVHRRLDTARREPVVQVAEVVAELDDCAATDLTPTYERLDHLLENVFSDPPAPEAQVRITFTYEGYRVTVEQDGSAQFVKV